MVGVAGMVSAHRGRVLALALALDLVAGEPPSPIHPVIWIGRAVSALEQRAPREGAARQLLYGAAMSGAVVGVTAGVAILVTRTRRGLLGLATEAALLKSVFAVRALLAAGEAVRLPLVAGDLEAARSALRSLVSRDTRRLSPELIAAAAIESLAENLTDSALAPWLAYAIGGLPAAAVYRALNTLDSMIGYRGRYEYLGKTAARADDLANLVPARLGALLIGLAAPLGHGSARRALGAAWRQHARTASPNAGWTMAAMAGALGVTLEKPGVYILRGGRPPGHADLRRAQRVTAGALALGVVLAGVLGRSQGSGERRRATPRRIADG